MWKELFEYQIELLKEMKESYKQKSEFEDKLKDMEEKDKGFKELRIKNELESRKKSQINLRTVAIMKRLGKVLAKV